MDWTEFRELSQSTGVIFLAVLVLWVLLAGIIWWAASRGLTSLKEDVKHRMVEDDKPVSRS